MQPTPLTRVLKGVPLGTVLVAAVVVLLAYDNGTYGLERRGAIAIAVWWAVIVAVGFGLGNARFSRAAVTAAGLLAAFALWTFLSVFWAPSAEAAFNGFCRTTLYLGAFALALLAGRRALRAGVDGIADAISVTVGIALISRFFPGLFPGRGLITFLADSETRLSFPLGYWNGLGIFAAIGLPLLVARAAAPRARSASACGIALAPVPLVVAAIYLASSRGGILAALVGIAVLIALVPDRWLAAAALLVGGTASAVEIGLLRTQSVIVDGPLGTHAAASAGHKAAALTAVVLVATGAAWALVVARLPARRPPALAGRVVLVAGLLVVVAGIALGHPGRRFDTFRQPPGAVSFDKGNFVGPHLASGAGSGRWQFWTSAVDEWKSAPLVGRGSGTFASWWAEHGSISYYVQDAHSLYLQTFGELGAIGGLLLLAFVAVGLVAVARRALAAGDDRLPVAAAAGGYAAWVVGAGVDWMWQLPVVTIVGVVLLGLALSDDRLPARANRSFGGGVVFLAAGWLIIVAQAVPFVARLKIDASQTAVQHGNLAKAASEARTARKLQPWAASPYLQLALVAEERGDLTAARREIGRAISRSPNDWRLWLVSARLATKDGAIADARHALHTAERLNPRSPLFS